MFGSCHPKTFETSEEYEKEFYSILNGLIQFRFKNLAVVVSETMPVFKNIYGNFNDSLKFEEPPPPPLPGIISYDRNNFEAYIQRKYIDSIDASYMYNSIDSTLTLELDSSKIVIPVISDKSLKSLFSDSDKYRTYSA